MNRLIKFSDALCHPVSARRPSWSRDGFGDRTREQLAEIGRAFARGDKRTVDQVCEDLKATSLRRVGKTFPETFLEGNENSYLSAHLSLKYLPDSVSIELAWPMRGLHWIRASTDAVKLGNKDADVGIYSLLNRFGDAARDLFWVNSEQQAPPEFGNELEIIGMVVPCG